MIRKATIEFDELDRIGHFSGISEESLRQPGVSLQRMLRDYYPFVLAQTDWFVDVIARVEEVTITQIQEAFRGLHFYQRGGADSSLTPCNEVSHIYQQQLRYHQREIRKVIVAWLEWMRNPGIARVSGPVTTLLGRWFKQQRRSIRHILGNCFR
jgi:hypothetical protein